ncbi:FecCD family ABC transporter permease [Paenibacillus physcomitrellae]|uniref:Ferrichrome ABC transporter permease n=1 Tax=Paenibacillus physcomitrellae TaxID=1619311 RepID=A0ABQ1FWR5_9BACL|nr:iron ABC transporter permease [Paenibacillus physcomitrellae]GGA30090.1 ferrichrome ABC transporter permease [Paenibacillus physcomitrellae]
MRSKASLPVVILMASPVVMILVIVLSVMLGAKHIPAMTVWDSFFHFDGSNVDHQIIFHSRLPRAVGALLIGAFLAVSGAVMQGMTRNYLASPSIMGVSDGSVLAVTLCMIGLPGLSSMGVIGYSMLGSATAVCIVFGAAALLPDGLSPVKLAILGTLIGTFMSSLAAAAASYFQLSQQVSFWYNARLHQLDPHLIKLSIPFAVLGLSIAFSVSKSVTVLSLGEEVAAGLGQRTLWVKGMATLSVIILTGISVALAGNIGFVGLIIPHITRYLVGVDYRWIVPCSGVLGGIFLTACDVVSRFANYPFETPIGVITAIIGVPYFLYLIRSKGAGKHA